MLHNGDGLTLAATCRSELAGRADQPSPSRCGARPVARVPERPDGELQGPAPRRRDQPQPRPWNWVRRGRRRSRPNARSGAWPTAGRNAPTASSSRLADEDGHQRQAPPCPACGAPAKDAGRAASTLRESLGKLEQHPARGCRGAEESCRCSFVLTLAIRN
ncbi:MAG: hypothetical protein MZW92_06320 [Comamonadaceae bacterium]|nr:hypothetical protein [Comamonadaceae bacterium]